VVLSLAKEVYLGIDLGGTKIAAAVVDTCGCVLGIDTKPSPPQWTQGLKAIVQTAEAAVKEAGCRWEDLKGLGLGAPGFVDYDQQEITFLPNLPQWQPRHLGAELKKVLGLSPIIDNDANAAALAEYLFGAGQGAEPLLYLTVSTGIGGGMIIGGRVFHGRQGLAAEVGHMILKTDGPLCGCGQKGCWEALASGTAIALKVRQRLLKGEPTSLRELADPEAIGAREIFAAAACGDPLAGSVVDEAMRYCGQGINNLVRVFNPERIVVGGGVARAGESFFRPLQFYARECLKGFPAALNIVPASLGKNSGVIGAAALAMQERPPKTYT